MSDHQWMAGWWMELNKSLREREREREIKNLKERESESESLRKRESIRSLSVLF